MWTHMYIRMVQKTVGRGHFQLGLTDGVLEYYDTCQIDVLDTLYQFGTFSLISS